MAILDEKGRLFGLVNVVDLAVVLVVLGLVVGGMAFVFDAESEEAELPTTEAHLVFGDEPNWLVSHVEVGEELETQRDRRVEILDVHVGSSPESGAGGVIHGKLTGPGVDEVRAGEQVSLSGDDYSLDTLVADTGEFEHQTQRSAVLLETTVSESLAAELEPGTLTLAGNEVGSIEDVTVLETTESTSRVHLGVDLETAQVRGDSYFGNTTVAPGQSLRLATAEYELDTIIISVDATSAEVSHVSVDALAGADDD